MDEKRLFIADDNLEFARFCARVAGGEGWTVTVCEDGIELLDALEREDGAALLLCDVNMPRLDGFEMLRYLGPASRRLLIRFMTGGAPINAMAATILAREHGLVSRDFLVKPIPIARLREALSLDAEALRRS